MKISVNKLQIIRPEKDPKKPNIDLDVDWYVDFKEKSNSSLEYSCTIKTSDKYPITFRINGTVGLEDLKDPANILPSAIFDNSLKIMLNMLNLTKSADINIKTELEDSNSTFTKNSSPKKNFVDMYPSIYC
ncbi:hypothetical protein [Methanobacterium sp. MBAC-LM]|uniref:hypothetical protein n=1 Tax=Methanobacterium sp. MBAC-LM TaxID=3412034 RepID=UPI003C71948D